MFVLLLYKRSFFSVFYRFVDFCLWLNVSVCLIKTVCVFFVVVAHSVSLSHSLTLTKMVSLEELFEAHVNIVNMNKLKQ